jgi:PAS domain-containing protein
LQSTIKVALQRHRQQEAAAATQSGFAHTLNSIGNGAIVTDRQGIVTFINPVDRELTGWTQAEALGQQISQIFRLHWETDGIAIENPSLRAMRLQHSIC